METTTPGSFVPCCLLSHNTSQRRQCRCGWGSLAACLLTRHTHTPHRLCEFGWPGFQVLVRVERANAHTREDITILPLPVSQKWTSVTEKKSVGYVAGKMTNKQLTRKVFQVWYSTQFKSNTETMFAFTFSFSFHILTDHITRTTIVSTSVQTYSLTLSRPKAVHNGAINPSLKTSHVKTSDGMQQVHFLYCTTHTVGDRRREEGSVLH